MLLDSLKYSFTRSVQPIFSIIFCTITGYSSKIKTVPLTVEHINFQKYYRKVKQSGSTVPCWLTKSDVKV
jgi:hypothetical protein